MQNVQELKENFNSFNEKKDVEVCVEDVQSGNAGVISPIIKKEEDVEDFCEEILAEDV